jgi:uncharacterized membrane protein (UPF0182 family)
MHDSIEWPRPTRRPGRGRWLLMVVLFAVVIFGSRTALSYYIDSLWFGSLGYGDVFRKTLGLQWGVFAAITAATFLILYGTFLALRRAHLGDLPSSRTILLGGQPVTLPVEPVLRLVGLGVSLVIALVTGAGMMSEWPTLARYWYAPPANGGGLDPILGKPLNFYLFTLPVWELLTDWLVTLSVMTVAAAVFFFLISVGSSSLKRQR